MVGKRKHGRAWPAVSRVEEMRGGVEGRQHACRAAKHHSFTYTQTQASDRGACLLSITEILRSCWDVVILGSSPYRLAVSCVRACVYGCVLVVVWVYACEWSWRCRRLGSEWCMNGINNQLLRAYSEQVCGVQDIINPGRLCEEAWNGKCEVDSHTTHPHYTSAPAVHSSCRPALGVFLCGA